MSRSAIFIVLGFALSIPSCAQGTSHDQQITATELAAKKEPASMSEQLNQSLDGPLAARIQQLKIGEKIRIVAKLKSSSNDELQGKLESGELNRKSYLAARQNAFASEVKQVESTLNKLIEEGHVTDVKKLWLGKSIILQADSVGVLALAARNPDSIQRLALDEAKVALPELPVDQQSPVDPIEPPFFWGLIRNDDVDRLIQFDIGATVVCRLDDEHSVIHSPKGIRRNPTEGNAVLEWPKSLSH